MTSNPELQQELMMLWQCRVKSIEGLPETGRRFSFSKPMNYFISNSQKNYNALLSDMKKQMRLMRKQTAMLQKEMNRLLKLMNTTQQELSKG